jgi:hypothetical protein
LPHERLRSEAWSAPTVLAHGHPFGHLLPIVDYQTPGVVSSPR